MTILLPALAIAFAAVCVWLGVRFYNRRERWAKWPAVTRALTEGLRKLTTGETCGRAGWQGQETLPQQAPPHCGLK
jgi:hypothetical protein